MRASRWPLLVALAVGGLLGGGCVDLTPPPELKRPWVAPAALDGGVAEDEAGGRESDPAPAPADAASPDAAPAADAPALPDAAAPPPDAPAPVVRDAARPDQATPPVPRDAAPPPSPPDVAPPPPDVAPPDGPDEGGPPLLIDDFEGPGDGNINRLGSEVTSDHQSCHRAGGELVCVWDGTGSYHDFIESLHDWCEYDARPFKKLRFKMRTSVPAEVVDVFVATGVGGCQQLPNVRIGTVVTRTTMTSYEVEIPPPLRERLILIELDPQSTNDTVFVLDDLELVR